MGIVQLGKNLRVINFIPRERVTKNGKPFTNITSAVRVTLWICSNNDRAIFTFSGLTAVGRCHTNFLRMLARSGPNMVHTLVMSDTVIGQLLTAFVWLTTYFIAESDGCAIIACTSRALLASSTWRFVYPSKFCLMVSTIVIPTL